MGVMTSQGFTEMTGTSQKTSISGALPIRLPSLEHSCELV